MTDTKNHTSGNGAGSLEGRIFQPASPAELAEAIELAFDYRGDVTIGLRTGEPDELVFILKMFLQRGQCNLRRVTALTEENRRCFGSRCHNPAADWFSESHMHVTFASSRQFSF